MIEILTLRLKPGTRHEFHQLYITQSIPLQEKWNINVVSHGPSLHDENIYYIVRSFKSLEDREKTQDDFYGSDDWQNGPRIAILGLIGHIATIVILPETMRKWSDI